MTTVITAAAAQARASVLAEIDAVAHIPAPPGGRDELDEHVPPELAARWARADPDQVSCVIWSGS